MGEERSASAGRGDGGKKFMMRQAQPATQTAAPPHRGQRRQGYPATLGQAPRRRMIRRPCSGAAWVQSRGCKGRSPLHKKTKNLPLPHGGRGSGGWGQKIYDAAGSAGNQKRRAPHRGQRWQGYPATPGQAPHWRRIAPLPPRRLGSVPGMQGAKPLA